MPSTYSPTPVGLPQTLVVNLGADSYYVRPRVEFQLPEAFPAPSSGHVVPAVVIYHADGLLSRETVQKAFASFRAADDVFQELFTSNAYLIVASDNSIEGTVVDELISLELGQFLRKNSLTIFFAGQMPLPDGPYFVKGLAIHQAWRIYPDDLGAFTVTVVPDDNGPAPAERTQRFKPLPVSASTGGNAAVAVPSRLYAKPTKDKPLGGRRIAIKDNMHLTGVVTSLGNRAYAELYGSQHDTADFVQTLIDNGYHVVGKTKLSAFSGSEVSPNQCIDYFPSWNPRGDGYQGPSGSSSGAGASAAGYDWLDLSLCTNTTGSMRFPATSHGVWGQRVTWGSLSMEGVVPACKQYDTFVILARKTSEIHNALAYGGCALRPDQWPSKILYPTEWSPLANKAQQQMTEEFLAVLEDYLGTTHTKISLEKEWWLTGPEHLRDRTIADIEKLSKIVNLYDNYHLFDDFRSEYRSRFEKPPYVSPSHMERWNDGARKTREERDEAEAIVNEFREWSRKHLFRGEDEGSSAVMLVPYGMPGPSYRDGGPSAPPTSPSTEITPLWNAQPANPVCDAVFTMSIIGAPQLIVPIGQNPYDSRVSEQTEYTPIGTSIVGPPGSEMMLLEVAQQALEEAGWPTTVLTGRVMFELGDNVRNSWGHE